MLECGGEVGVGLSDLSHFLPLTRELRPQPGGHLGQSGRDGLLVLEILLELAGLAGQVGDLSLGRGELGLEGGRLGGSAVLEGAELCQQPFNLLTGILLEGVHLGLQ